MDLLAPPPSEPIEKRASDFVAELQSANATTRARLETSNAASKAAADTRREVHFNVGDFVWAILTRDRYPAHEYNKLVFVKLDLSRCWRKLILMNTG